MKPTSFLRSSRLEFRLPEVSDADRLVGWVNDPEVRRHLDHRIFPVGLADERKWIEELPARIAAKTDVVMLVVRQSDGELVGSAGIHDLNWVARWGEFGILLGREHWGQGYGREVTARMLRYAFEELNLSALRLRVNASHERGLSCYRHVGFEQEGVLRQAVWNNGAFDDQVVMSVLKADWEQRDPPPAKAD